MDDGVHQRLPDRNQRNRPTILPADALDDRFVRQVLVCECYRFFRGSRQEGADLRLIEQTGPICSGEATRLHPGIRKPGEPVPAEKQQSSDWLVPDGLGAPWRCAECSMPGKSFACKAQTTRKQLGSRWLPTSAPELPARRTSTSGSSASTLRSAVPRPFGWSSPRGQRLRVRVPVVPGSADACYW